MYNEAVLNLLSTLLIIIALGLVAAGSWWSGPMLALSVGAWWVTDKVDWDVEVLGGLMILLFMAGTAYAIVRSIWITVAGWL